MLASPGEIHPVQHPEPRVTSESLNVLFDAITYDKTAAVLMMWDFAFVPFDDSQFAESSYPQLESSIFVPALASTFRESEEGGSFLFDSASIWRWTDHHHHKFQPVSNPFPFESEPSLRPVSSISTEELITPWFTQVGLPMVTWTSSQAPSKQGIIVTISQEPKPKDFSGIWTVPLALRVVYRAERGDTTVRIYPFVLGVRELRIQVHGNDIRLASVIDGSRGFGLFVLCEKPQPIPMNPAEWQNPFWQLSTIADSGMGLQVMGMAGSPRHGSSSSPSGNACYSSVRWRALQTATMFGMRCRPDARVFFLVMSRIAELQGRCIENYTVLLEATIKELRRSCCHVVVDSCGCKEIVNRSWVSLIMGGAPI
eukprot:Protomagalhaensia_wolfi_Nauph_80__1924@NODE_2208_length_1169_cov_8_657522_g1723_i0_p1_GENE_NODE_2208_length_1169_cov_8_657522_g1723_i0NODE_2208_length_1169_cov_8_657522_g1723_i0_p1_ORF_typecomplete_len369_score9_16_NODE_2208_length_1169_cov_8_657522_g1723_i0581164